MQFFPVLADLLVMLMSIGAAILGGKSLRESLQTKKWIVRFSRGNVVLQQAVIKSLEDGDLSKEEIEDFARELESELQSSNSSAAMKKRTRQMIRKAIMNSPSRRLVQEIIFEVVDEVEKEKRTTQRD